MGIPTNHGLFPSGKPQQPRKDGSLRANVFSIKAFSHQLLAVSHGGKKTGSRPKLANLFSARSTLGGRR
jgi:hypothetical protein